MNLHHTTCIKRSGEIHNKNICKILPSLPFLETDILEGTLLPCVFAILTPLFIFFSAGHKCLENSQLCTHVAEQQYNAQRLLHTYIEFFISLSCERWPRKYNYTH